MRSKITVLTCSFFLFFSSFAQLPKDVNCLGDSVSFLSIGSKRKGLCFGNPNEYNGFRFSFIDKNCLTNGVVINFFGENSLRKTNGIDIGLSHYAGSVNGLLIGILSSSVYQDFKGFNYTSILTETYHFNGIGFTFGFHLADLIKGASIAGISVSAYEIHGLGIGSFSVRADSTLKGLGISVITTKIGKLKGAAISCLNRSIDVKGIQIGLINRTDYLNGAQVGLFNYVASRPRWCRLIPLINFGGKSIPPDLMINYGDVFAGNTCKYGALNFIINEQRSDTALIKTPNDSLTIVLDRSIDPGIFRVFVNGTLVTPKRSKRKIMHVNNLVIKFPRNEELDLIKIVSGESKKCMEIVWSDEYNHLFIERPYKGDETVYLMYSKKKTSVNI